MNERSIATRRNATSAPTVNGAGALQRRCACGTHTGGVSACSDCNGRTLNLQRKLMLGATNDPLELEADRIADQVLASSSHPSLSGGAFRTRHSSGQAASGLGGVPASVDQALASPGKPLEPGLRQDMEQRFGYDFSRVRVHADALADRSARDVNALAYTAGSDLVFGTGRFVPDTYQGRRLIAHELTHVVQQSTADGARSGEIDDTRGSPEKQPCIGRTGQGIIRRFAPEDAAIEMLGKTFVLNADVTSGGHTIPAGSKVVVTAWSNTSTMVTADFGSGSAAISITIEKHLLTPAGDTSSGLFQYHAGVADIERKYVQLQQKITDQQKVVADWQAQAPKYTTPAARAEWQRQLDVKQTDLKDLQYKLTGIGYTSATLPDRLKTTVRGARVSITPQSALLNKALIEEAMFNAFDASVAHWVNFYNSSIGAPKGWPALDPNLVKSMLYQESHMGTQGDFLIPPPYVPGARMTRFNIGQTIDSSGPQQIMMIKEIDPAKAALYHLDQVTADMLAAQERRKVLVAKGAAITPPEQLELDTINARSDDGNTWNHYFITDPRWSAAVTDFFDDTVRHRNLDYDYWIRTMVRWLFEKRNGVADWAAAIKAYNGSGSKADIYKKDVIGRRDAARAAPGNFVPTQHY